MRVYRIEHSALKIGPANLFGEIEEIYRAQKKEKTIESFPRPVRQIISILRDFIAGENHLAPSKWDDHFGHTWRDPQSSNEWRWSHRFGGNEYFFEGLLKILHGDVKANKQELIESVICADYRHSIKNPQYNEDDENSPYFLEEEKVYKLGIVDSYLDFLNLGSDFWKCCFGLEFEGGTMELVSYEVDDDLVHTHSQSGQMVWKFHDAKDRRVEFSCSKTLAEVEEITKDTFENLDTNDH